jgi:hypothetical protein
VGASAAKTDSDVIIALQQDAALRECAYGSTTTRIPTRLHRIHLAANEAVVCIQDNAKGNNYGINVKDKDTAWSILSIYPSQQHPMN